MALSRSNRASVALDPLDRLARCARAIAVMLTIGGCLPSDSSVSASPPSVPIPDPPPHPRLFVTPEDVTVLRRDCLEGEKRGLYGEIRSYAARQIPERGSTGLSHLDNAALAFVYLVEGDERFGRAAAAGLMAMARRGRWHVKHQNYWYMALTYDHVFPLLSRAEVDTIARVVRDRIKPGHILKSPFYNLEANAAAATFVTGVALYGDASSSRDDEHFRALIADGFARFMGENDYHVRTGRARHRGGVIPTRLHHAGDGGYQKDRAYTAKDLGSLVHFAEATRAIGMFDAYAHAETYFTRIVDYLLWSTRPDGLALRQMTGQGYKPLTTRGYEALAGIARRFRNGRAAWLIQNRMAGEGAPPTYDAILFALLWDPSVAPEAPSIESMGRWILFGAEGLPHVPGTSSAERFIYRSGWDISGRSEDFLFHLDASDYLADNVYWTVGGFELFHRGALAIKSGYYGGVDDHYRRYQTASISANTIVIHPPGATPGRGLQDDIREVSGRPDHLDAVADGSPYDRGGIDSVRVVRAGGREWVLASAVLNTDAIYRESRRARSWERRVAVTDGIAVVYDRVEPREAGSHVSWLLHTIEEPVIDGSIIGVDVPGRVSWHSGSTVRLSRTKRYGNFPNGGTLRAIRILPTHANTRKIGGDGYAFWVDETRPVPGRGPAGTNHAIEDPDARTSRREAGAWRVEIHPLDTPDVVEFLVVLDSRRDAAAMSPTPAIDASVAGVTIDGATIGFVRSPSPGPRFHVGP